MRRLLSSLAVALLLPLAACGDDDPAGPEVEAEGTYTLRTVNGASLPVTIVQVGTDMIEVLDGTIELKSDNTFTDSTTFRITEADSVVTQVEVATGTYAQTGTALTLTPTMGDPYALSVSGSTLTQTVAQFVLEYRK